MKTTIQDRLACSWLLCSLFFMMLLAQRVEAQDSCNCVCDTFEWYSLHKFYHDMDGPNWINQEGWAPIANNELPARDCRNVNPYGIYSRLVDGKLRVTKISLPGNKLNGAFGPELRFLNELREFNCPSIIDTFYHTHYESPWVSNVYIDTARTNTFEGLEDFWFNLWRADDLEFVDMSGCGLTGDYLYDISLFPNLKYLDLSHNQLTGEVPFYINVLLSEDGLNAPTPKLEVAKLANNNFRSIPSTIREYSSLKVLDLSENRLSYDDLDTILLLSNYEDLRLSFTFRGNVRRRINQAAWNKIFELSSLKVLDMSLNLAPYEIPASVSRLDSLTDLNLNFCLLDGPLPADLFELESLEELHCSNNKFTGSIPDIKAKHDLKVLNLAYCDLEGTLPESISNLHKLRVLDARENKFNQISAQDFNNLSSSIEFLEMRECTELMRLPDSISFLSNLIQIDLSGNNIEGDLPVDFSRCWQLRALLLNNCNLNTTLPYGLGNTDSLKLASLWGGNSFFGCIDSSYLNFCDPHDNTYYPVTLDYFNNEFISWDDFCRQGKWLCTGSDGDDIVGNENRSAESSNIRFYPSPLINVLNIAGLPDHKPYRIWIYNSAGMLVYNSEKTERQVDLSFLSTGAYNVMVNIDGSVFSDVIIKE